LKPPIGSLLIQSNSKALPRADHTARDQQIQRSVDLRRLALVGFESG
jgi:hypothetical protein